MAEMTIRAATPADIDMIHAELMDVIASSPHYSDRFKAHEMGRLDKNFLRKLLFLQVIIIIILRLFIFLKTNCFLGIKLFV